MCRVDRDSVRRARGEAEDAAPEAAESVPSLDSYLVDHRTHIAHAEGA